MNKNRMEKKNLRYIYIAFSARQKKTNQKKIYIKKQIWIKGPQYFIVLHLRHAFTLI